MDLAEILKVYGIALLLAFITEAGIEFFFGMPMDKIEKAKPYKWLLMYLSLAAGLLLAYHYALDVVTLISGGQPDSWGMFLTGTIIGRGSNFVHSLFNQYILKKPV